MYGVLRTEYLYTALPESGSTALKPAWKPQFFKKLPCNILVCHYQV